MEIRIIGAAKIGQGVVRKNSVLDNLRRLEDPVPLT